MRDFFHYCHTHGSNSAWCVASLKACTRKNHIKRFPLYVLSGPVMSLQMCWGRSLSSISGLILHWTKNGAEHESLPPVLFCSALLILSLIFTPTSPGQPNGCSALNYVHTFNKSGAVRLCSLLAECQDNCWINLVVWDSSMRNCCIAQSVSPLAHWCLCPLWRRDILWQMEPVPEGLSGNT